MKLKKLFIVLVCIFVLAACASKSDNQKSGELSSNAKKLVLTKSEGDSKELGSFAIDTKMTFNDNGGVASELTVTLVTTYHEKRDYERDIADSKEYYKNIKVDGLTFKVEGNEKKHSVTIITTYDDKLLTKDSASNGVKLSNNTESIIKNAEKEGFIKN
ncbi:hypothetical protein MKA27_17320 [[Clostridium] innocuum]|nr:hypothetical protein [[Clostridium] innocuum]MCR0375572.1 hypothetical protein [[Clostridium] innocuum]MCR0603724.1 hypothetical protein [[Clostridium] innocuum]